MHRINIPQSIMLCSFFTFFCSDAALDAENLMKQAHHFAATGHIEQALDLYDQLIAQYPQAITFLYNKAYCLKIAGQLDKAIELYKKSIAQCPTYEPAYFGLAMTYLAQGNFKKAWPYYKRHIAEKNGYSLELQTLLQEKKIRDKTIFLHYQGGLGDSIHFIRYAQVLKGLGATVIVYIQEELVPLFSRCPYIDKLVTRGAPSMRYDVKAALMSLPALFESNEETIPRTVPYLFSSPELVSYWQQKIKSDNTIKIGLCWQANQQNDSSRYPIAHRGIPLHFFDKLSHLPNITLISLQKYDGENDLTTAHHVSISSFNDLDTVNGPFMDTAAIMKNLDLVISVDTATAHLAGALGVPVCLLLPYSSDWRWIHERTDSPWYPSMRIFKQKKPFNWQSVIDELTLYLQEIFARQHTDSIPT